MDYAMSSVVKNSLPNFQVSEAVFLLSTQDDDKVVKITHDVAFKAPEIEPGDDIIANLAIQFFKERFDGTKFIYNETRLISEVVQCCVSNIIKFYEANANVKKPRQTVLYGWIDNKLPSTNSDLNDSIVLLYKYISENKGERHTRNALGILNLLKEKYE